MEHCNQKLIESMLTHCEVTAGDVNHEGNVLIFGSSNVNFTYDTELNRL